MLGFLRGRCSLQAAIATCSASILVAKKSQFDVVSNADSSGSSTIKVQMVTVLHRHGARTPVAKNISGLPEVGSLEYDALWGRCPRVPQRKEKSFLSLGIDSVDGQPCRDGFLTQVGADMLYSLGQYLHSRYGCDFFFRDGGLTVRATASQRTWVSAASLLQGLCPGLGRDEAFALIQLPHEGRPGKETMWGTALLWDGHRKACPRLHDIFKSVVLRHQSYLKAKSLAFQRIDDQSVDPVADMKVVSAWSDYLDCLSAQRAAMPRSFSDAERDLLEEGVYRGLVGAVESESKEGANLSGGRLLADVHALVEQARLQTSDSCNSSIANTDLQMPNSSRPLLFNILSGHDVSLISFLGALGYAPKRTPGFGASCILELLQDSVSGKWYVRIIYHDEAPSSAEFHGVELLHAPIETWTSLVQTSLDVANNWEKRCTVDP